MITGPVVVTDTGDSDSRRAPVFTPEQEPGRENTALVIVTFRPDPGFPGRLDIASAQFPATFLVDNTGSESQALAQLDTPNLHLIRNPDNRGLGTALNQGCQAALEAGYHWVVTLDQDSALDAEFLQIMLRGWRAGGAAPAVLGSNYFSVSRNAYKIEPGVGAASLPVKTVITSGCLTHLPSWHALGGFREDYFIDSLDHEFCLRARRAGLQVRINRESAMRHTIGEELGYAGWLRALAPFSHSPLRKYTGARNTLRTIVDYAGDEPLWCGKKILGLAAEFVSILLLESGKGAKVRAFLLGLRHGAAGRMGPVPEGVARD